jgi:hypothetical protein
MMMREEALRRVRDGYGAVVTDGSEGMQACLWIGERLFGTFDTRSEAEQTKNELTQAVKDASYENGRSRPTVPGNAG